MKMQKKVHSAVVRDSANTFGTNAVSSVLGLLASFIVLRRVNPDIKGLYNTVQTWGGGLNTILGLSISSAVIYFVAKHKIQNVQAAIKKLTAVLAVAIVLVGAAVLFCMRNTHAFEKATAPYLVAIVVYGLCSFLFNICMAILRGEDKFKSYNTVNLTQRILVSILAVLIFLRPSAAVWVWATNGISFTMILFALYGIRRWSGPKPQAPPENDFNIPACSMVKYGLKSHVSNVMTYLNLYLGSYIVQGISSLGEFAIYSVSVTMTQQLWILPDAVSQVIMSRIAGMTEQRDKLRLTLLSSKIVIYLTVVTALLLLWAARILVPIVFPMYAGAVVYLQYLIVGSILISFSKVLGNSIFAYGRPELNIIPTALGIAANVVSLLFLMPIMGVSGVAVASSVSMSVQGLSCVIIFCRFTHTAPYKLLIPSKEEVASVKAIIKR